MTGNIEGTCSLLAGARRCEDEMSTYEGEAPIGDVGLLNVGDWTRTSAMQRQVWREPRQSKRQDNSK